MSSESETYQRSSESRQQGSLQRWRRWRAVHHVTILFLVLMSVLADNRASASSHLVEFFKPTGLFLQAGTGDSDTQSYTLGALWDWHWQAQTSLGKVTGYSEASFGRWTSTAPQSSGGTWATQAGITPVLRQFLDTAHGTYFAEIGIGANVILPLYHSGRKQFSTQFNFGDHLAIGRQFGELHKEEISLRFQHYSNAGIDHPNPGENFFQLRYARRF